MGWPKIANFCVGVFVAAYNLTPLSAAAPAFIERSSLGIGSRRKIPAFTPIAIFRHRLTTPGKSIGRNEK
jgi:hypothetical protein